MSSLLKNLYTDNRLLINVVTIITIYIFIYITLISGEINSNIDKNWYRLKTNPAYLMFSGLFSKRSGSGIIEKTIYSFMGFFNHIFKKFIGIFIKPFLYFFKLVNKALFSIRNTIGNFRKMAQITRNLFKSTVEKTAERISNSYAAITYFQEKLKLIIKKQSAMFALFKQFTTSLNFILYSFMQGPVPRVVNFMIYYATLMMVFLALCMLCAVGGPFVKMFACPACAICFDKDTLVTTKNGPIAIKDIKIGTLLTNNDKVTGIIKVLAGKTTMYNYNNIVVSGTHLVKEKYNWIRVKDSRYANKIEYSSDMAIYCLTTSSNQILIENTVFADYRETDNSIIQGYIDSYVISRLNNYASIGTVTPKTSVNITGFSGDTLVKTLNRGLVSIKCIQINDKLEDNTLCLGVISLSAENVQLYNYNNIVVSGDNIVYDEQKWKKVHSVGSIKKASDEELLYHIITDSNWVTINKCQFRDFIETDDKDTNIQIDNLVEDFLNLG